MIPLQLKNCRFNRVLFKDKKAFEMGWQNKPYSYEEIQNYFPKENYGVMCGSELRVLDDDTPDKKLITLFLENFKETFRVRDHLYFKFDNGYENKIIFMNGKDHLGELQGKNTYVVGPGSTHPSGEIYEQKNDLEIKTIPYERFKEVFDKYLNNTTTTENKENSITYNNYDDDFIKSIKEKWTEGNRQDLAMSLAGYLRKKKRLGLTSALSIVENICNDCKDHEVNMRLSAVRSTYEKDEDEIKGISGLNEKGINNPYILFEKEGQALEFIKRQPLFFDKSGIWWIWDFENSKYIITDKTQILANIKNSIGANVINSKERTEIINALEIVGREHLPEPISTQCIQFKNKIVNIKTGEEIESTPKMFSTNPLPWNIGKDENTPTMDKYFLEWVGEQYVQTLYEILAYSACSDQFMQRMIALVGGGSNGKGTFIKLLKKFIGKDNCTSSELRVLSDNQFETSSLYKKLVCEMGEVSHDDLKNNANQIKKLSGQDDIRYCFKGKTPFSEESPTTCLINTNSLPISKDKTAGFYRRWLIIDFPNQFSIKEGLIETIPDFEFENLAKKSINILKEMYKTNTFCNEGNLDERAKKYEERSNPVMRFIEDFCDEDCENYISLKDFSKVFNEYLKDKHLRSQNPKEIKKNLTDEGFDVRKTTKFGINDVFIFNLSFNKELMLKMPLMPLNETRCLRENLVQENSINGINGIKNKFLF